MNATLRTASLSLTTRVMGWLSTIHLPTPAQEASRLPEESWLARTYSDQVIDSIPNPMIWRDLDTGKAVRVNRAMLSLLKRSEAEVLGRTVFELFSYEEGDSIDKAVKSVLSDKHPYYCHIELKVGEQVRHFSSTSMVFKDVLGVVAYGVTMLEDVTDQVTLRNEVKAHVSLTSSLMNALPNPVVWFQEDYKIAGCNTSFASFFGRRKDDLANAPLSQFTDLVKYVECSIKGGCPKQISLWSAVRDSWRDVLIQVNNVSSEGFKGYVATLNDVTELVNARRLSNHLTAALDNCSDAVMLTDGDDRVLYFNAEFRNTYSYDRNFIGQPGSLLRSGHHSPAFYKEMWDTLLSGTTWSGRLIDKTGQSTFIESDTTVVPLMNGKPEPVSYLTIKHRDNRRVINKEM